MKPLSERKRAVLANPAHWKLARRVYNTVTLCLSQITGVERHKIYARIDEPHELAMLNTASAAMRCGASIFQVCVVFVEAWKRNERRQIDIPPLTWFCSTSTAKHLRSEVKRQKYSIGTNESRESALSLARATVATQHGLITLPSLPYRRTQKTLDKYTADRVTARVLCDAINKRARKKRIGFLYR